MVHAPLELLSGRSATRVSGRWNGKWREAGSLGKGDTAHVAGRATPMKRWAHSQLSDPRSQQATGTKEHSGCRELGRGAT